MRIRGAFSESGTDSQGRHRTAPVHVADLPSGAGARQVPPIVFLKRATEEAGPSWLSFVGHTTDSLWSVDLWRCASIVLQSDWVLVVMDQFTRRLVGFGVHRGPVDAPSLCRMCNAAIHGRGAPRHLSTDHDPLFEAHRWTANLRLLEIDAIKTVPHVPLSHPFVERLIGTMRRECLDHVLFWNAGDLERKLADFQAYYNAARSHASLEGYTPLGFAGERTAARAECNHVRWISHCRGMVQLPAAADDEFETDRFSLFCGSPAGARLGKRRETQSPTDRSPAVSALILLSGPPRPTTRRAACHAVTSVRAPCRDQRSPRASRTTRLPSRPRVGR